MMILIVYLLVQIMGTDNQVVWVNPQQVISIREPRGINQGHWAHGTRCLILTTDGKFFTTVEPCEQVLRKLGTPSRDGGRRE